MRCPKCKSIEDRVIDSRPVNHCSGIRRRRVCLNCEYRFTTYERMEEVPLVVVKSHGAREPFDRAKIIAGVVPIQGGTRELGSNVIAGYFAQNRLDNLDVNRTVMEEAMDVRNQNPDVTEKMARTILGGFLFRKRDA